MRVPAARRRQRSTRLTVAAALLLLSALLVFGALLSGSWLLVASAAVLGVLLGAAATRITHSELVESRREAGRDRAAQALAYRELTVVRTAEHASFVTSIESRIAAHQATIGELEVALGVAHQRAAEATRKMNTEARRADVSELDARTLTAQLDSAEERAAEAIVRVAELESELDVLGAEIMVWQSLQGRRQA